MISVGRQAPDFSVEATTGGKFTLSDYQGKKNVVVMFFPLAFTPV